MVTGCDALEQVAPRLLLGNGKVQTDVLEPLGGRAAGDGIEGS